MPKQKPPARIIYAVDPLPGGICARCGAEHLAYEDPTLLDFFTAELGIEPEVIDQWRTEEREGGGYSHPFTPRVSSPLGRPKLRGNEGDKAEKNRLAQARFQERQKAALEGREPPKWAKKRE